jgi:hypothetical protein
VVEKLVIGLRVSGEPVERMLTRWLGSSVKQQDQFERKRMFGMRAFEDGEFPRMSILTENKVRGLQVRREVLTPLDVERSLAPTRTTVRILSQLDYCVTSD